MNAPVAIVEDDDWKFAVLSIVAKIILTLWWIGRQRARRQRRDRVEVKAA